MRPQSTWVPVWDLPVRLFHWALVLCVSVDLIFAAGTRLHVLAGFGVLGLISFRLIWGLLVRVTPGLQASFMVPVPSADT